MKNGIFVRFYDSQTCTFSHASKSNWFQSVRFRRRHSFIHSHIRTDTQYTVCQTLTLTRTHTCLHFRCATKINYFSAAWFSLGSQCVKLIRFLTDIESEILQFARIVWNRLWKRNEHGSPLCWFMWSVRFNLNVISFASGSVAIACRNLTASKRWLFNFDLNRRKTARKRQRDRESDGVSGRWKFQSHD